MSRPACAARPDRADALRARRHRRPDRARHLATRPQGVEGEPDRHGHRAAVASAAGSAAARRLGRVCRRRTTNTAASPFPPNFSPARRRWFIPPAPPSAPTCRAPAIGCSRRHGWPAASIVVVDRGFIPLSAKDAASRAAAAARHRRHRRRAALAGNARPVHARRRAAAQCLVSARSRGHGQGAQWSAAAPFYVEQESPVPEGGVPKPGSSPSIFPTITCNTPSPGSASPARSPASMWFSSPAALPDAAEA